MRIKVGCVARNFSLEGAFRLPAQALLAFWEKHNYPVTSELCIETQFDPHGMHFMWHPDGFAIGIIDGAPHDLTPFVKSIPGRDSSKAKAILLLMKAGVSPYSTIRYWTDVEGIDSYLLSKPTVIDTVAALVQEQPDEIAIKCLKEISHMLNTNSLSLQMSDNNLVFLSTYSKIHSSPPIFITQDRKPAVVDFIVKNGRSPLSDWEINNGRPCMVDAPRIGSLFPLGSETRLSKIGGPRTSAAWRVGTSLGSPSIGLRLVHEDGFTLEWPVMLSDVCPKNGVIRDRCPILPPAEWSIKSLYEKLNVIYKGGRDSTGKRDFRPGVVADYETRIQKHIPAKTAELMLRALAEFDPEGGLHYARATSCQRRAGG